MIGLAWPFFSVLGLLAAPIVETLYGPQWRGAAPLVQAMCLGAFPLALTAISMDALTGVGQIRSVFRINLVMAAVHVGLTLAAAPHGLLAVAFTLQLAPVLRLVMVDRALGRYVGPRLRDMYKSIRLNLLASLITAMPALTGILAFGPTLDYSVVLLLAVLGASACAWLGSIYLLKPPVYKEIDPIMRRLNDVVFHR